MTTCARPNCSRDTLTSRNPDVVFAYCSDHTDALLAQAFGASDSQLRAAVSSPLDRGPELAAETRLSPAGSRSG